MKTLLAQLVVLLGLTAGCSTVWTRVPLPPSEELRAEFGTVGVVSLMESPAVDLEGPTSGKLAGAGKGAMYGLLSFGDTGDGSSSGSLSGGVVVVWLLLLPVFVVVGSVTGAVVAEPAREVRRTEAALFEAFDAADVVADLRGRIVSAAARQTDHELTDLGHTASRLELAERGIDTLLELSIQSVSLSGSGVNPPVSIAVDARCRTVRIRDGATLHDLPLHYRGGALRFTEWAEGSAAPFREELDRVFESLAVKVVEELFLLYLPSEDGVGS